MKITILSLGTARSAVCYDKIKFEGGEL